MAQENHIMSTAGSPQKLELSQVTDRRIASYFAQLFSTAKSTDEKTSLIKDNALDLGFYTYDKTPCSFELEQRLDEVVDEFIAKVKVNKTLDPEKLLWSKVFTRNGESLYGVVAKELLLLDCHRSSPFSGNNASLYEQFKNIVAELKTPK